MLLGKGQGRIKETGNHKIQWGFPWHPLANNSTKCNPFLALEVSFGAEKFQGGASSHPNLMIPLTFLSYMCIF